MNLPRFLRSLYSRFIRALFWPILFRLESHLTVHYLDLMSAISNFAAAVKAFNTRQAAAIDGLVSDVQGLKDKIDELQNSPGEISPEDQALLDELQASAEAVTAKLEALDQQTPPASPPVDPNA